MIDSLREKLRSLRKAHIKARAVVFGGYRHEAKTPRRIRRKANVELGRDVVKMARQILAGSFRASPVATQKERVGRGPGSNKSGRLNFIPISLDAS